MGTDLTVHVAKALEIPGQRIPETTIVIAGEVAEYGKLSAYRGYYAEQGGLVADALIQSLPGGTLDALLVALLDHKRSLLAVAVAVPL